MFWPVVDEVLEKSLRCGDLHDGYARIALHQPRLPHEDIISFSCKGSRQFVIINPILLSISFKYDRKLMTRLYDCANESLKSFFRTEPGLDEGNLGVIMVIHTFK